MAWNKNLIHDVVEQQRAFFASGETLDIAFRKEQLKRLRAAIEAHRLDIEQALYDDLGRCASEAYLYDVGPVLFEIDETLRGLSRWARPELLFSGVACFPSIFTRVYKLPYGVSLIISPFNFPFMLSVGVLAASIAGGNTSVLKASSKSAASTRVLQQLIAKTFPENYITVVDGGHDVADLCLEERFDKIFYTGSPRVGKHVLEMAAQNLTPVTLELGGETGNWCIVRKDADIQDAARKIAFFKLCNAGQVCININQVAVAEEVAEEFISALKAEFERQIGAHPLENSEYTRLINRQAFEKCAAEAELYRERIVHGGEGNPESLRFEPTVIYPVAVDEPIVMHELFCPLLPVVPFADADIDSLLELIASREHGLALYLFTGDRRWANKVMASQQYGGGCINEVCLHLMVKGAPFNGVGHSGMGAYHGEWGFREFTHPSTVLTGSRHFNLSLREHPYEGEKSGWKNKLMHIIMG